jgi:phospholipid transport system transporter-binding protein
MLMLPKVLMHEQVDDTLRLFRQTLASDAAQAGNVSALTLDGSALERFDSSALAVVLACRRMAHARGRSFLTQSLPPKLLSLATLYGIDTLLSVDGA